MRWTRGAAWLIWIVVVLAPACGTRRPIQDREASGLDEKFSRFAFIEEGDLVVFVLGTRPAWYREEEPYIPFEIAIGNRKLRGLTLTRESFTLIDEEGNRYPAAGPEELISGYRWLDLDRQSLAELPGIVFQKFANYTRAQSKFSPTIAATTAGAQVVRDRVSLGRFYWLYDFLYFPRPATGVKGHRFELFVEAPELDNPIFVKFAVE